MQDFTAECENLEAMKLVGGTKVGEDISTLKAFKKGVVIVATPGRLCDIMQRVDLPLKVCASYMPMASCFLLRHCY